LTSTIGYGLSEEIIESKIFLIRGKNVMLDRDLAVLYGVETKALKQTVKRNPKRFPEDFMFELTQEELTNWRSQFVTSKGRQDGLKISPLHLYRKRIKGMICAPILSTIEPIMSTKEIPDSFSTALFGKTKRALPALFFFQP
jgi:hypothetical protein